MPRAFLPLVFRQSIFAVVQGDRLLEPQDRCLSIQGRRRVSRLRFGVNQCRRPPGSQNGRLPDQNQRPECFARVSQKRPQNTQVSRFGGCRLVWPTLTEPLCLEEGRARPT